MNISLSAFSGWRLFIELSASLFWFVLVSHIWWIFYHCNLWWTELYDSQVFSNLLHCFIFWVFPGTSLRWKTPPLTRVLSSCQSQQETEQEEKSQKKWEFIQFDCCHMFYGLNDNIWPILLCPSFVMVLKANFITLARCLRQFLVSKASANKWIRNVWTGTQLTDAENKNEKEVFLSLQTCCVYVYKGYVFLFDSNCENSNSLKKCCFELEQSLPFSKVKDVHRSFSVL